MLTTAQPGRRGGRRKVGRTTCKTTDNWQEGAGPTARTPAMIPTPGPGPEPRPREASDGASVPDDLRGGCQDLRRTRSARRADLGPGDAAPGEEFQGHGAQALPGVAAAGRRRGGRRAWRDVVG